MFDYKMFETNLIQQMKDILDEWMEDNEDIYILSLDCSRSVDSIGVIANTKQYLEEQLEEEEDEDEDEDDYWYYKYCEDEWELFETFEDVSADMCQYLDANKDTFINPETCEYTDAFDAHFDKIIESCMYALSQFKQAIKDTHPSLLLTLNVGEYLEGKERIEIFEKLNSKDAVEEYAEHIDDFA